MYKVAALLGIMPFLLKCDTVTLPPLPPAAYTVTAGFSVLPNTPPALIIDYAGNDPKAFGFNGPMTPYVLGPGSAKGDIKGAADFDQAYASVSYSLTSLSEQGLAILGVSSFASTSYFVEVQPISTPPTIVDFVPVIIRSTVSASCSGIQADSAGSSQGGATATVTVQGSQVYNWTASCDDGTPQEFTNVATDLFGVRDNVPVNLEVSAGGLSQVALLTTQSAQGVGMADPTFQIDPLFQYASYFEILYSDAGSANLPEPSAFSFVGLTLPSLVVWKLLRARASRR